jgi:hypothetical protein
LVALGVDFAALGAAFFAVAIFGILFLLIDQTILVRQIFS